MHLLRTDLFKERFMTGVCLYLHCSQRQRKQSLLTFQFKKYKTNAKDHETPTDEPEQDTHKSFVAVKTHAFD